MKHKCTLFTFPQFFQIPVVMEEMRFHKVNYISQNFTKTCSLRHMSKNQIFKINKTEIKGSFSSHFITT